MTLLEASVAELPERSNEQKIQAIEQWLVHTMLGDISIIDIFSEFSERINNTLFPLLRSHISMREIHPFIDHTDYTWFRGVGISKNSEPRPEAERLRWTTSPLFHMVTSFMPEMHCDLTDPEEISRFPIFSEFEAIGATDYVGFLMPFDNLEIAKMRMDGMVSSWLTDRQGGFTDSEIVSLRRLVALFSAVARIYKRERTLEDVLSAYLGPLAGEQILAGKNQRGDGDVIQAVIWICDLRNSSSLADKLPMSEYLTLLNQFFESMAEAVMAERGEVLKFMGDGFLAIFPTSSESDITNAVERSLKAAKMGKKTLADHPSGAKDLKYGIGIHHGDVMFGNIGAKERLDFSVIGPAVNMASRLQDLTKELDVDLLISAALANRIMEPWRDFPPQTIAGLKSPVEVKSPVD